MCWLLLSIPPPVGLSPYRHLLLPSMHLCHWVHSRRPPAPGSWLRVRPSPRYVIHASLQGHIYAIRSIDRWSIVPHSHWSAGELHAHMQTCKLAHTGRPCEVCVTAALCKLSRCRFLWLFLAFFSLSHPLCRRTKGPKHNSANGGETTTGGGTEAPHHQTLFLLCFVLFFFNI